MINKQNKNKQILEKKKIFSVCKYGFCTSHFQICESFDKFCFHLVFAAKIFDFCASLGDAGTGVPARKLHTRPGYINTCIVPGLIALCPISLQLNSLRLKKVFHCTLYIYHIDLIHHPVMTKAKHVSLFLTFSHMNL